MLKHWTMKKTKTAWLTAAIGLALLGAPACKSDTNSNKGGDEAEAVEADKEQAQKEGQKEGGEQKEGAATKKEAEGHEAKAKKEGAAVVGESAPDFTLTDANGEEHSLSDYEGKIVVLEWFSPECPYVQRHHKAGTMTKTYKAVGKEEVVWLAVDSSHFNKPKHSKAFKKKHDIGYPVLQDTEGDVGKLYGAKTTPHMYVIDEDGVLRYQGAIDDDKTGKKEDTTNYVREAVEMLKGGEAIETKSTKPYGCSVKYEG